MCPTVAKWRCDISAHGLHGRLQTAITFLFQIQIEHRLKLWTPDFPSFKTRYCMHKINFEKCSNCVQQLPKWGCGCDMSVHGGHVCSWCARWRILRCGGFAAILQLRNECTGLPNGTRVPKSGFAVAKLLVEWGFGCENWEFLRFGISQSFRSCEMRVTMLRSGTRVPKVASQLRNPLGNGAFPAKMGSFMLWWFAAVSQLQNGSHCAAKWHSVPKLVSQLRKFLQRGAWGCELISQQSVDFAEAAKSRRPLFFPCFWPVFAPKDFLSISLQFLLVLIIQKLILHKNKLELKHWNQN